MDYISGFDRNQMTCFMGCMDELIDEDNPVRFIDAYVDKLDLRSFQFQTSIAQETGRPAYNPSDLLKLYIYGYYNRIRSSRNLEKECHRNLEVIWLMKSLKPDHKTISRFRQNNPKALKLVFRDFVYLCTRLGLYGKELIAVDGSKFKAWNSKDRNFTIGKIKDRIRRIDEKIESYFSEMNKCDLNDCSDNDNDNQVKKIQNLIKQLEDRKAVLKEYEATTSCGEDTQVSLTDPDSRLMKTKDGMQVSLNVQTAVDGKNKMIVEFLITNQTQDRNMMAPMAKKASEILEAENMIIVADNGYDSISDVAQVLADKNYPVVAGAQYDYWYPAAEDDKEETDDNCNYDNVKMRPVYLPDKNVFVCPMKEFLHPTGYSISKHQARYYNCRACSKCQNRCTQSLSGIYRAERLIRLSEYNKEYDATPVPLKRIHIPENKEIVRQRKCIVEHPFGTIKNNMGVSQLLLRTIPKAEGEIALAYLVYNMKRAIKEIGVKEMIKAL